MLDSFVFVKSLVKFLLNPELVTSFGHFQKTVQIP